MQATDRISLRTTPHTKSMIEQACQLMGVSISSFILETAYHKAMEIVKEGKAIQLNEQEWQNAVAMLNADDLPDEKMQALFQRGFKIADNSI